MVIIAVAAFVFVGGGVTFWLYQTHQPPFCSGYPPGGDCPGNYSNTFLVSINYTGPWRASWFGYHSVGATIGQPGNYTGGTFSGNSPAQESITLSGPNTNGLAICVQAEKLDPSNSTLTVTFLASAGETSQPFGQAEACGGVVP